MRVYEYINFGAFGNALQDRWKTMTMKNQGVWQEGIENAARDARKERGIGSNHTAFGVNKPQYKPATNMILSNRNGTNGGNHALWQQ